MITNSGRGQSAGLDYDRFSDDVRVADRAAGIGVRSLKTPVAGMDVLAVFGGCADHRVRAYPVPVSDPGR